MKNHIYLDNAATSWPKPTQVASETNRFLTEIGVSPDRSVSGRSETVKQTLGDLRCQLAELLGAEKQEIHFPFSTTDGLNLIISGLIHKIVRCKTLPNGKSLSEKVHVVSTATEHNSVLRPLHYWQDFDWIDLTILECDEFGLVDPAKLESAITDQTGLFILSHASGVTGCVQDASQFGKICQKNDVFFLLDAAQTAGSIPLGFSEIGANALVCSGHKSLLGPMGTGVMIIGKGSVSHIDPARLGGTGTQSHLPQMPEEPAVKWSAGHQNVPGLFGLAAAVGFLKEQDLHNLHQKSWLLCCHLVEELERLEGFRVLGNWTKESHSVADSVPIVSVVHDFLRPAELAAGILESGQVVSRAGFHCAPLIHSYLSSSEGGTLRFSPGIFSTEQDILSAVESLEVVTQF